MIPLDPELRLCINRTIKAPREKVYDAFIIPELRKQWWAAPGDRCTLCEIDARVGGRYRINMIRAEAEYILTGVFQELLRPEKQVFTWSWELPAAGVTDSLVTLLFSTVAPDVTELTIIHERLETPSLRDQHAEGWAGCMTSLAAFVEPGE